VALSKASSAAGRFKLTHPHDVTGFVDENDRELAIEQAVTPQPQLPAFTERGASSSATNLMDPPLDSRKEKGCNSAQSHNFVAHTILFAFAPGSKLGN
jgi:hypothetical protein